MQMTGECEKRPESKVSVEAHGRVYPLGLPSVWGPQVQMLREIVCLEHSRHSIKKKPTNLELTLFPNYNLLNPHSTLEIGTTIILIL